MIVKPVKHEKWESEYMQMLKIKEEVLEADNASRRWMDAIADGSDADDLKRDYALKLGDIIVACVTELRWGLGYDEEMCDELMRAVELKNRRRGYYD